LRWKLSDVKTSDYISFQLICRIVDEDVLTGVKTANYKNTLNVTQDGRYVDQATTSDIKISKTSLTKELGAAITGNKISFKLDVNKLGEDLDLDKSTVTVIDEMCSSFTLKPETLQFTDKNGNPIDESLIEKKYEVKDGVTYMTFVVPDSMEVIITYDAIINAEEGEIIPEVSNVAHWKGKVSTTSSVWSATNFSYTFLSSVTLSETPSLKVIKLSSEDITKTLAGAEFKVQEATFDSEGNVTLTGDVHTGTTNADGVLYFSKEDGDKWLRRNRVYAVTETKAPTGYNLAQTQYIALTTKGTKKTFDSRVAIQKNTNEYELYVYDSPIRKDYVLPEAGGSGVTPITAIGTALITTGTLSYVYIGRRRRKRRS
jgi:hypothetical protein